MVSPDRIRDEGLTTEDVLDYETERPQEEVEILPEWQEHPEEAPGSNLHIDGDQLVWERDGFEARLWSYETTHWKAQVSIPREYGKLHAREIDVKSMPLPEHGFVEGVEIDEYAAVEAELVLCENFMPTWEVNKFIDYLVEQAEGFEEFQADLEAKLDVARENEA